MIVYDKNLITTLNKDLEKHFTHLFPITNEMRLSFSGVSRLVMLDRYTQKDISLKTLKVGDLVLTIIKDDPKFPARGIGYIKEIKRDYLFIQIDDEFIGQIGDEHQNGLIKRQKREVEKPLELYYEQIPSLPPLI